MPKLAAFVDSLDTVEEPFRSAYVADGARFKLDADGVEDVTGLKSALAAQTQAAKDRKAEADEAKRLLGEKARAETAAGAGISEQKLQELRDEDARKRREELEPVQTRLTTAEQELRTFKLTTPVKDAYLAAGMYPDEWDERSAALLPRYDLGDQGGVVVKDERGQVTHETLAQSVAKHREKYPRAYQADVGGGGGAARSNGGSRGAKTDAELAEARRASGRYSM